MTWLSRILGAKREQPSQAAPQLTMAATRPVIGPSPDVLVMAPPRFAWDEKRWQRRIHENHTEYTGRYRVYQRRAGRWLEFDGSIIEQSRTIAAYIASPPVEMKAHRHGACLQLSNSPWFRLHWTRPPANVDEALLYMERMLHESFNGGGWS